MTESRYEYLGQRAHQPLVGRRSSSDHELDVTHRKMIQQLLPGDARSGRRGTFCAMVVGPCYELNLRLLLDRYHEVHLVGGALDELRKAVDGQKQFGNPRIHLHAGIDPGGQPPGETRPETLGRFDVVLSSGVLQPTLEGIVADTNDEPGVVAELIARARREHVADVLALLVPDGQAVIVTSITDSRFVPELRSAPADLAGVLREVQAKHLYHPGCNPAAIDVLFAKNGEWAERISRYDVSAPWLRQRRDCTELWLGYRLVRRPTRNETGGN
jgi:hypothetical protein